MNNFHKALLFSITESIKNFFPDNFDYEIRKLSLRRKIILTFEILVNNLIKLFANQSLIFRISKNNYYLRHIDEFENTFNLLANCDSKKKYIELLVYRMLGFTKIKLSLNTNDFWIRRAKVDTCKQSQRIPVNFRGGYLDLYDLRQEGYDLKLYFLRNGIFVDFVLQQYNYQDLVSVKKGDIVIDAGGCWGDTALYFASRGASKVFVYEFIPSNVDIMKKNFALNEHYVETITLVEHAVWDISNEVLSYLDRGPSSRVDKEGKYTRIVHTLSIDDLVTQKSLPVVNFIKMDIEGAEMSALKGAANTIRKYKPRLAISVYHKEDDMILIPAYLKALNPDYKLYMDYFTIVGDEIMIYAIDENE